MQPRHASVCFSQRHSNGQGSIYLQEQDQYESRNDLSPKNHDLRQSVNSQPKNNKLPINLFYSTGQYRKMLITNGRSVEKSQPLIDGFQENLSFINDSLFHNYQNERQERIKKFKINSSDRKKPNNSITCCQESVIKHSTEKKKPSTIKVVQSKKKKVVTSKIQMKIKYPSERKNSQEPSSNSYLSHKEFQINNLIMKSLMKFEAQKKEKSKAKITEKQQKLLRNQFLKSFQEEVRHRNKTSEKVKSKCKSQISKSKKRMMYWSSYKDLMPMLLKQNIKKVKPLKKQMVECNHKPAIASDLMIHLRKKYQEQAKSKIKRQSFEKKLKEHRKRQGLKKLQKKRQYLIESCVKKPFVPSPHMIEHAFIKVQ